jgi:cysteine desulfurase
MKRLELAKVEVKALQSKAISPVPVGNGPWPWIPGAFENAIFTIYDMRNTLYDMPAMPNLYCDYNSTTPLASEVYVAMEPYLNEQFGNPSSTHCMGRDAQRAVRKARRQVAAFVGAADENEIIFTSGGTESNNTAIRSALELAGGRKKIITSTVEHSSVKSLCDQLEREGYEVFRIPVDRSGHLDLTEFDKVLDEQTGLVTLMMANNETGILLPVEDLAPKVKSSGVHFHVDAVQALGKLPLDLKTKRIHSASFSAHKCYGPKGVGALYLSKDVPFHPYLFGGSQERGRRAGTENVAGIVGFGEACEFILKDFQSQTGRVQVLRRNFEERICVQIPKAMIHGRDSERLPNTSLVTFPGLDGEALMYALDQKGICVSMGSACMSGSGEPSYVLKAMGYSTDDAKSSLRVSFGRYTTETEIAALIQALVECVKQVKK